MRVFGVGANLSDDHNNNPVDVSQEFKERNLIGTGWTEDDAPDLHRMFNSLEKDDVVYLKSLDRKNRKLNVIAIGIVIGSEENNTKEVVTIKVDGNTLSIYASRKVKWIITETIKYDLPIGKNNVRMNTIYEEFHPEILEKIRLRIEESANKS